MSPRAFFLILFLIVPVLARGRGGGGHGSHGGHGGSHGGGGSHSYPASTGYSGHSTHTGQSATYPHSSTGLSGNNRASQGTTYHKTEVHHHHYSPPQQIHYGSGYHPVYHERPPVYVYEYRNSGSRFNTLLTGLALYNLGRMSSHHDSHYYDSHREYRGSPGEMCKLQISRTNGEFEETRIDCKLMSSYIWEAEREREQNKVVSTNIVSVTNTTSSNGTIVTTSTQNTTVVDALTDKGPSIQVTPGMNCFMIRISRDQSILKKKVECGLLQAYAMNSFNHSCRNVPATALILFSIIVLSFN